jgi:hypothetical protein
MLFWPQGFISLSVLSEYCEQTPGGEKKVRNTVCKIRLSHVGIWSRYRAGPVGNLISRSDYSDQIIIIIIFSTMAASTYKSDSVANVALLYRLTFRCA